MTSRWAAWGLLALGLMVAGCETVERDEAGTICRVRDSDGRLYTGQEYNQAELAGCGGFPVYSRCARSHQLPGTRLPVCPMSLDY